MTKAPHDGQRGAVTVDRGAVFERAVWLDRSGQSEAARAAYLEVLAADAGHAGALNELGRLLARTGYREAARSAFARAVALHPADPVGHGNLAGLLLDDGDEPGATRHYERALALDPGNAAAAACLAVVALRRGDVTTAAAYARVGFAGGATAWPYRGTGRPPVVLALHSALGGNVHVDRILDDRAVEKWTIVAEFWDARRPLPPHDLVFNAIGDGDRCRWALRAARALLAGSRAPVINRPAAVRATSRVTLPHRRAGLPGVIAPRVTVRSRAQLGGAGAAEGLAAEGFTFPLILRAPGFHTGRHCRRVDDARDLAAVAAEVPAERLFAIEFVDVRRSDGAVCKYRAMTIRSRILPVHLAVSEHWMVHGFTATLSHRERYRAEETAFITDPVAALGRGAVAALESIAARLGLDCGGIDFALDATGRIVVFEANATMIAPPPPPGVEWAARRAAVERLDAAIRELLMERAAIGRRSDA